jgi:hypothetical protein
MKQPALAALLALVTATSAAAAPLKKEALPRSASCSSDARPSAPWLRNASSGSPPRACFGSGSAMW